jgi:hypothetical protein
VGDQTSWQISFSSGRDLLLGKIVWSYDTDNFLFSKKSRDVSEDSRVSETLAQAFNFQRRMISWAKERSHNQRHGFFTGFVSLVSIRLSAFLDVSG